MTIPRCTPLLYSNDHTSNLKKDTEKFKTEKKKKKGKKKSLVNTAQGCPGDKAEEAGKSLQYFE